MRRPPPTWPRPLPSSGPSGLGLGERFAPCDRRSHSIFHGRSSPAPSGAAGVDRVLSFRSVLRLIREFHSMEGLASGTPIGCELSRAPISGLLSESFRLFTCPPLSPLLWSLLGDSTLALSLFLGYCPSAGFLPVPGRFRRRFFRILLLFT